MGSLRTLLSINLLCNYVFLAQKHILCSKMDLNHVKCIVYFVDHIAFTKYPHKPTNWLLYTKLMYGSHHLILVGWGGVIIFVDQGGEVEWGLCIFFMPLWQTFLINVIKRLFSWKKIKFGYIKYELGGDFFIHIWRGLNFCAGKNGGCNLFLSRRPNFHDSPPPIPLPPILNGHTLTRNLVFVWSSY